MEALEMAGCKGVTTPGSRDEVAKVEKENGVTREAGVETEVKSREASAKFSFDGGEQLEAGEAAAELPPGEATKYRAASARLNYLCQDRLDIAYACKEAARKMSRPQKGTGYY